MFPVTSGHALVVPRRHAPDLVGLTDDERAELWFVAGELAARKVEEGADGVNVGINCGEAAGQTVAHVHVHVIPRFRGDVKDPRGGIRWVIPDRAAYWPDARPSFEATQAFGERLLGLLEQARFSATYKFALLIALIDLCLEGTDVQGRPPRRLSTAAIANKVVELYWRHALPFAATTTSAVSKVLHQNNLGQAAVINYIEAFRRTSQTNHGETITQARTKNPRAFGKLLRDVEWKLAEMPIPKLQTVGAMRSPFIYTTAWPEVMTKTTFTSASTSREITFVPGAAEHMIRLSGLMRPLIQTHWAGWIADTAANKDVLSDSYLDDFLFGADRIALRRVVKPLRALQAGSCFYCGKELTETAVDHFLPWARYADNGIHNLVVTCPTCNRSKSDLLASARHVTTWVKRFDVASAAKLRETAVSLRWEQHPQRTLSAVRATYLRMPDDLLLWDAPGDVVPAGPDLEQIKVMLSDLDMPAEDDSEAND